MGPIKAAGTTSTTGTRVVLQGPGHCLTRERHILRKSILVTVRAVTKAMVALSDCHLVAKPMVADGHASH